MGASASKIKFRESLTSLTTRDVSPDDAPFWDELWKIPSSSDEVFELLTPSNARKLRDERFDNLATLFTQATAQLCQIVETPYTIYFDQALNCVRVLTRILPFLLEKGDLGENDPNVELLCWGDSLSSQGETNNNDNDDDDDGKEKMKKRGSSRSEEEQQQQEEQEPLALLVVHAAMHMMFLPQFTCDFYEEETGPDSDELYVSSSDSDSDEESSSDEDDEEREDETITTSKSQKSRQHHTKQQQQPVADKEKNNNMREYSRTDREIQLEAGLGKVLRIKRGISIHPRPAAVVWAPGVGFTLDGKCLLLSNGSDDNMTNKTIITRNDQVLNPELAFTRKYDKNRIEVLRLLLAACSDPLFSPADEYNPLASRWMSIAVAADSPNASCLFYSLLNTVVSYDPSNSSFGGAKFASDTHVKLVELSAQVLCVLLDCGLSGSPVQYENKHGEAVIPVADAYESGFNVFRVLLARINRGRDLNVLFRGFVRLLRNAFESQSGILMNSPLRLDCYQELLVLLWKTLEENPLFLDFILTRCDVCELIVPICYLMNVSRKESAQVGLVHICTFILLKLSGERSFGVSLNRPFRTKLPCDLPLFTGSHADLICITLHKIVVSGSYRLVSLYSCFLTVICNFSPYWRSMSLVSSVKMVNLFELFSSPKFLYSGEKAYRHVALLLEIFNNVIQYQYNGNQHLVYAIVRRKDSFGRLASLTLSKAVQQCDKAFPASRHAEYDADMAEQVAALSIQEVDERGNPSSRDDDDNTTTTNGGSTVTTSVGERFVPNEAWITELKSSLPIETVNRLLQHLVPIVDEMCERKNGVVDEIEILEVFKDITMVGLLPVPHAIVIRKYQPNQYTSIWFTAFMWGVIFLRSQAPPIFDGKCIELFQVSQEEPDP